MESTGGYLQFCVTAGSLSTYKLYEYDPNDADEYVGEVSLTPGGCASMYVDPYVDGDNRRAELYVGTGSSSARYAAYYD